MVSEQPTANRININAAEQDDHIESVTVFQSNRAEVKRRVNLELKQGQNHVQIERLPSCINEDSIRVDGTGTAVIFDVVYHAPTSQATQPTNETVAALGALKSLQTERGIIAEQLKILGSYGHTLDSKNVGIEDVQRFLDVFAPRQIAVSKHVQDLDVQITKAQEDLNKARSKVYADAQGERRGTRITVTVLAATDGSAELVLTYVMSNARWTPLYDVRASIAKSPDMPSNVALHYRASITQTTGENWPDVALTLSTASPQQGSKVPTLRPWRVGFPASRPQPARKCRRLSNGQAAFLDLEAELDDDDDDVEDDDDDGADGESSGLQRKRKAAPFMEVRQAQVTSAGVLNTTFGIPGRSDIPSDGGSHKVVIAVLNLDAELEWVCVPREKESVFLTCKVVNASEFTLLPGEASVFMDDNFVSKSRIEHVSPNDSFKTSLGVDSALRVTYPTAGTLNRTSIQSSFPFLATKEKQALSAQSQRITIRNSRFATVAALRVLDHVPVSTDARIKVAVITPNGLDTAVAPTSASAAEENDKGKGKERPWTNVQKGVKVRWAPLDVGGEGTVEWRCEIAPMEEVGLELAWEVSAPVGQQWQRLEN